MTLLGCLIVRQPKRVKYEKVNLFSHQKNGISRFKTCYVSVCSDNW